MAEFLIYDKDHWMDSLTQKQINDNEKEHPGFKDKYNRRYQRGDIIEVQEDGFWTQKRAGFGSHAFSLIVVPGLLLETALQFTRPLEDTTDPDNPIVTYRRKFQVNMSQFNFDENKIATVNLTEFNGKILVKG